jgi:hypothetical protein
MSDLMDESRRLSDDLMDLYREAHELLGNDTRYVPPENYERLRDILAQSAAIGKRQDALDEMRATRGWTR